MDKWALRTCAFVFVVALGIFSIQAAESLQRLYPCNANIMFSIDTTKALLTKETIANDLAKLGSTYDTLIGKVSPNPEKYRTERDIIHFSGDLRSVDGPALLNGHIFWLDQTLSGAIVPLSNLTSRSLNGEYFARGSQEFIDALASWGEEKSIEVEPIGLPDNFNTLIMLNLLLTDSGILVCICALLPIAAACSLLRRMRRRQRVEIVGGKTLLRVRASSCFDVLATTTQGYIAGLIVICFYLLTLPCGFQQLSAWINLCAAPVCILMLIESVLIGTLAFCALPSIAELGSRFSGTALFSVLCIALELIGIVFSIYAASSTFGALRVQDSLLSEARMYESIPEATRLSLLYTPGDGAYEETAKMHEFLRLSEESGHALVSLDVNQSMELSDDDLSGYDHFVIANKAYLDAIGVGLEAPSKNGTAYAIPPEEVPVLPMLQSEMWLADNSTTTPTFYRYEGPGFFALGANTGKGGDVVEARNPIILVLDQIESGWSYSGFVIPLLSSGNLFFNDYEGAYSAAEISGISDLVSAFDNIAELSLQQAQDISKKVTILILSVAIALVLMMALEIQSAAAWCSANARSIFAKRSSGYSLSRIATHKLVAKLILVGCGSAVGLVITILIIPNNAIELSLIVLIIFCLIASVVFISRICLARLEFYGTANRR